MSKAPLVALLAAALLFSAAGCGAQAEPTATPAPTPTATPAPTPTATPAPTPTPRPTATPTPIASGADLLWRYETGGMVQSSPVVAGTVVYTAVYAGPATGEEDEHGHVDALDASTGDLLWRFETGGWDLSSPVVAGGVAYVGSGISRTNEWYLDALDASTGDLLWRFETGGWRSSPVDGVACGGR